MKRKKKAPIQDSRLGSLETKSHLFTFYETHSLRLIQAEYFRLS